MPAALQICGPAEGGREGVNYTSKVKTFPGRSWFIRWTERGGWYPNVLIVVFDVYCLQCLFIQCWMRVSVFSSVYNCCGERLHLNFIDRETQRLPTNTELGIAWGQKSNEMNSISVMKVVFATLTRQVAPSPTQVVRKNVLIGRIPTPGPVSHKKCRLSLA